MESGREFDSCLLSSTAKYPKIQVEGARNRAMTQRVAILHYSSPPVIGGVESLIGHHANGLMHLGYAVRIISGSGAPLPAPIETYLNPLFSSSHPDILAIKSHLDAGDCTPAFEQMVAQLYQALEVALADCDICIAHNLHNMNKNLPLTAALHSYTAARQIRCIAYCHDIAASNPQYINEFHPGHPWDLLRTAWPETQYVTVSTHRRDELAQTLQIAPDSIAVISPGVDPSQFFGWTPIMLDLVNRLHLLDADGLLLLPARLTRRKNIELALHILRAIRDISRLNIRLIVSGPPGPHNPSNQAYLTRLLDLRAGLKLVDKAHFLYACGETAEQPLLVDDATMSNLYQLADALLFPSTQEGFGIPILEAALARLPIFCAGIPPLRETAADDAHYFDPTSQSPEQIAQLVWEALSTSPAYRLSVRIRHNYRWERIIERKLVPLLEVL
ncbi:MAG: glycosyltransferase family 4 protein [Anaerolineae bacterium]|nr:glycosyltransferase family 4 protein [Anaerolineae bacterium]